uniref:Uncharacterized protein n=1 Tax=Lactuca sativa TaxID=4236 RepID=A0A9R1XP93_LACSA|nr:hypothetical protein LSAT_V11C200072310 [Lactuca sativa]
MHPSKPETYVFTYSCSGSKLKIQSKRVEQFGHDFNLRVALFVEGSIREISSLGRTINERDYMLVDHKHKNNFYKTTKVHISNNFAITVVSTNLMKVIIENLREKRFMNLVDQDLS